MQKGLIKIQSIYTNNTLIQRHAQKKYRYALPTISLKEKRKRKQIMIKMTICQKTSYFLQVEAVAKVNLACNLRLTSIFISNLKDIFSRYEQTMLYHFTSKVYVFYKVANNRFNACRAI